MDKLLFKLINMSIPAGFLIIAVILLRLLFKKAPKSLRCVMWALVGIRLICPFSLESFYSLVPSAEVISPGIIYSQTPQINSGIPIINNTINPIISESLAPNITESVSPMQVIGTVGSYVWLVGLIGMLIYALISYIKLRRTTAESQPLNEGVWMCDRVASPFILGIIRPKIYVPSAIDGDTLKNVIAHEHTHIKRLDHLWKPLGFILLSIYWFNPLIWVAYVLLCRDIELACDERVIKHMSADDKANYSQALLICSTRGRSIAMCPLAFGEVGVKERIKRVLSYKKPAFWIIMAAIAACIVAAVCFLTNPIGKDVDNKLDRYLTDAILQHNKTAEPKYEFGCEDHIVLGVKEQGNRTTVYMVVMFSGYNYNSGDITEESSSHIPTVITVKADDKDRYTLDEYWIPRDGGYYTDDIKSKFPLTLQSDVFNLSDYAEEQKKSCYNKAKTHFLYRAINGEQMGLNDISKRNIYLYNPINNYNFSYSDGCVQLIYVDPDEDIDSIYPISMPRITFYRNTEKCELSLRDRVKAFSEYTYTLSDTRLVIKNVDLGYNYVFRVKGSSFIFDEKSSDKETKGDIIDGTEFVCDNAYEDDFDLYGCAYIDVDNDGEMEYCRIGNANSWYYSSFLFSAGDKYANLFKYNNTQGLGFVEGENGTVLLSLKDYNYNITNYYSISVENDNIILTQIGENINKASAIIPITLNNDIGNSKPTINSSDVIKTIKMKNEVSNKYVLPLCDIVMRVKITDDLTNKNSYFSYIDYDRKNFISMRTAEVLEVYRNTTSKEINNKIFIIDYAAINDDRMLYLDYNEEQLKNEGEYLIISRGIGVKDNLLYLTECVEKLNLAEDTIPDENLNRLYNYLVDIFGKSNNDINKILKKIDNYREG